MQLALTGHSKFKVEMIQYDGSKAVLKTAPTPELHKRLRAQMHRQIQGKFIYDKFLTPDVLFEIPEKMGFVMEFVPWQTPADYMVSMPPAELKWFYAALCRYFITLFKDSDSVPFDSELFSEKVVSTMANAVKNPIVTDIQVKRLQNVGKKLLALTDSLRGKDDLLNDCHGDFTLSNLLVDHGSKQIAWFDFIDGWNHSPLIDVAKLTQEMRYKWSLRFRKGGYTPARYFTYQERLTDLKEMFREVLAKNHDKGVLTAYIALNDYRLLQYETDAKWFDHILTTLEKEILA